MVPFVWPPEEMMLYLGIIKKYKHMFWIIFVIILFFIWLGTSILEFFEQMKESEYEIVRAFYWIMVIGLWISAIVWVLNW